MVKKPDAKAASVRKKKEDEGEDITQRISVVAYQMYEKRGRAHGNDLGDWLEAERIVLGRK